MSNTQYAFLKSSNIPTRELLQQSIDALGFDLELYPKLDLKNDLGFSPCTLCGIPDVGFEISSGAVNEDFGDSEEVTAIAGDNDAYICMEWRGSVKDCASVMIVSCALAKDFGAIISFEGEPPENYEAMLDGVHSIVQEAMNEKPDKRGR